MKKGTLLSPTEPMFYFILALIIGTIIFLVISRSQIPGVEKAIDGLMKAIGLG